VAHRLLIATSIELGSADEDLVVSATMIQLTATTPTTATRSRNASSRDLG
jgi:hypothetical protein